MVGQFAMPADKDYFELAALPHASRARISQIMNLLLLALDIQEEVLQMRRTVVGRDRIRETHLRPIVRVVEWGKQRRMRRERREGAADSLQANPGE